MGSSGGRRPLWSWPLAPARQGLCPLGALPASCHTLLPASLVASKASICREQGITWLCSVQECGCGCWSFGVYRYRHFHDSVWVSQRVCLCVLVSGSNWARLCVCD